MRIAVFGGTRGTGLLLVQKAVSAGIQVSALARRPEALATKFPGVLVVPGDVYDLPTVRATLEGTDAAVSTLGFVGRSKETTIYSEGVINVARTMLESGPRRLIVMASSLGIKQDPDLSFGVSIVMKLLVKPIFDFAYRDMAKMTDSLSKMDLDWTLVGVPYLTDGKGKGRWRSSVGAPLRHPFRISRADVAEYMLSIIDDPATARQKTEVSW